MKNSCLHLLLVDDDEDDRMCFEEALEDLKIATNLEHAANGIDAIQRLTSGRKRIPDIIFLDLNMPMMSGRECLEKIRTDVSLNHVKVVIYSTSLDPAIVDVVYETGANYYLRKPGDYGELKRNILTAINSLESPGPVSKIKFVINP